MNLFLTESGTVKLCCYGLITQSECYSKKRTNCKGIRSFSPEVINGGYDMKSDVWSLGSSLIQMARINPYADCSNSHILKAMDDDKLPFEECEIESKEFIDFLHKCFEEDVEERWSADQLMNVSVIYGLLWTASLREGVCAENQERWVF